MNTNLLTSLSGMLGHLYPSLEELHGFMDGSRLDKIKEIHELKKDKGIMKHSLTRLFSHSNRACVEWALEGPTCQS